MGDDLCFRRMVDGLDAGDLASETADMLLQVVEELALRGRRTEHEDLLGHGEGLCNVGKEVALVIRMKVGFGRPPRVTVEVVRGGAQPLLVEPVEVDVEDAGFMVVKPDSGARESDHGDEA
jgi:hypothetical protein